ncbi:MAG: preprotein translocase subunit SecG [Candidatus Paceibacterota bacterium]|jgi:protein translocase SecG subunit|nr:preprotein translocase subunit SecG [Candidatus Paceibacterota bacterium]MDD5621478.1 preprotein translocase subunit SecG [Candidatus Paceibacterota bacterium]
MNTILMIAQIVVSCALVVCVLIQQRGSALGSAFGQEGSTFYGSRRGLQKKILYLTIFLGIAFIALSMLNLYFSK